MANFGVFNYNMAFRKCDGISSLTTMRKHICLLTWILCMAWPMNPITAQHVSNQQAIAKAQAFLQQRTATETIGAHRAPRKAPRLITALAGEAFYVLNDEANNGFVIVSGEECAPAILGYSDEGLFNKGCIPEGLQDLLDSYSEQVKALAAGLAVNDANNTEQAPIEPLIKTQWSQHAPFNLMCPIGSKGTHCVTGCVPTAAAQVMYYYQWPQATNQDIPDHTSKLSVIPAETPFQWGLMQPTYDGDETEEQENAVAFLMVACGQAFEADYGSSSTSASVSKMLNCMKNYFGYNEAAYFASRNRFKKKDWETLIYEELAGGRPVVFSASHLQSGSGHMFLCDGYEKEHRFHFNFGWGGYGDGNYLLTLADPEEDTSYALSQSAIIALQPNNLPLVEVQVHHTEYSGYSKDLRVTSYTIPEDLKRDILVPMTFTVDNVGDDYFNAFSTFSPNGSPSEEFYYDIDAGCTSQLDFFFFPYRSGENTITLSAIRDPESSSTSAVKETESFVMDLGPEEVCYLFNPASGLYFCAANKSGTRASLGEAGMDVALVGDKSPYSIETLIGERKKHYLGSDLYCDKSAKSWTLTYNQDGTFSMTIDGEKYLAYDGNSTKLTTVTDPNAPNARWVKRSRTDIISLMRQASTEKPMDVSCLIKGADFGRHDMRTGYWKGAGKVIKGKGADENRHGELSNTAGMYQDIIGLPNGNYKLRAQAFYSSSKDFQAAATLFQASEEPQPAMLFANTESVPVQSIFSAAGSLDEGVNTSAGIVPSTSSQVSSWFSDSLYWNEVEVKVTDGTLRIGIRNDSPSENDWTCFDSFRLIYYGNDATSAPSTYTVTAMTDSVTWGLVTGAGTYDAGNTAVLIATPADGFAFSHWEEDGQRVSGDSILTVIVGKNRVLKAHFIIPADPYVFHINSTDGKFYNEAGASIKLTDQPQEADRWFSKGSDPWLGLYPQESSNMTIDTQDGLCLKPGTYSMYIRPGHLITDYELTAYSPFDEPTLINGITLSTDPEHPTVISSNGLDSENFNLTISTPSPYINVIDWVVHYKFYKKIYNVRQEVVFNNQVVTSTDQVAYEGDPLPEFPYWMKQDFTEFVLPDNTTDIITADTTLRYEAIWKGPFKFTTNEEDATWYNMHINNGYYIGKQETEPYTPQKADKTTLATPEYQWAFGGDPYHIKIYNRTTGMSKVLTSEDMNVVMRESDDTWFIMSYDNGFVLRKREDIYWISRDKDSNNQLRLHGVPIGAFCKLQVEESRPLTDAIRSTTVTEPCEIFTVNGVKVGNGILVPDNLPAGIYLMRHNNGTTRKVVTR